MFNKENKRKKNRKVNESFFARFIYWFKTLSFVKHLFTLYLFITIIGSLMLFTPSAHKIHISTSYADDLFTAASAFSDTGLVTLITADTWSIFGQTIIAILIFLGGFGWFALKVYLFNIFFNRPISFTTRAALSAERGSAKIGVTRDLIKISMTIMFIILFIASFVLVLYFYYVPGNMGGYHVDGTNQAIWKDDELGKSSIGNLTLSIRYGIFHAISALNNAGFDIIGSHSMAGFYHNYGIQIIFVILFVIGGVGYPVIYDVYKWFSSKFTKEKHHWSLFSKLSMLAYVLITLIGISIVFGIELSANNRVRFGKNGMQNSLFPSFWNDKQNGTTGNKTMALIFNTMSTRNAGFSTINMGQLSNGTLLVYTILMFIGSAPSSTAGGIRTTTMAIVILGLLTRMRGKEKVKIFNRRLPLGTVNRSYIVFTTAITIVVIATLITITSLMTHGGIANSDMSHMNPTYIIPNKNNILKAHVLYEPYNFTEVLFEVGSAFGTTGLSAGLTQYLSLTSKITLIFVMFIGQLGVSSSLLVWGTKKSSSKRYSYVKEDVSVG